MPSFPLKMHQNAFGSRASPGPAEGAHSAPPDSLAGFNEGRGKRAQFCIQIWVIEAPVYCEVSLKLI